MAVLGNVVVSFFQVVNLDVHFQKLMILMKSFEVELNLNLSKGHSFAQA